MMEQHDEDSPIWVTEFDNQKAVEFANAIARASKKDPVKPIVVFINSGGGEAGALIAMLSAMDSVPNKIVTVAMGYAMSAGAFLLAHGAVRFASPYARIMVHKIQAGAFGGLDDILNETEELVRFNHDILSVFAKDVKKSVVEVEKSLETKRELYLGANEAKTYGIVDIVGVPQVELVPAPSTYQIAVIGPPPEVPPTEVAPKKKKKAKKKAKK